jgi:hypothetical protein
MLVSEMQIYKIYLLKRHYDFDVVKNGTGYKFD